MSNRASWAAYLCALVTLAGFDAASASKDLSTDVQELNNVEADKISLCALMLNPSLDGASIEALVVAAEEDLRARHRKSKFEFLRATGGPGTDEVSLLFENLTFTDVYIVYEALPSTARLVRRYSASAFNIPLTGCVE